MSKKKSLSEFESKYSNWGKKVSSYFPKPNVSQDTIQLYANFMIIVAVLGVIPLATQCWRVWKTQEARGISVYAFSFQILISSLWLGYAYLTGNGIIIISSTLLVLAALTLVILTKNCANPPSSEEETEEEEVVP